MVRLHPGGAENSHRASGVFVPWPVSAKLPGRGLSARDGATKCSSVRAAPDLGRRDLLAPDPIADSRRRPRPPVVASVAMVGPGSPPCPAARHGPGVHEDQVVGTDGSTPGPTPSGPRCGTSTTGRRSSTC